MFELQFENALSEGIRRPGSFQGHLLPEGLHSQMVGFWSKGIFQGPLKDLLDGVAAKPLYRWADIGPSQVQVHGEDDVVHVVGKEPIASFAFLQRLHGTVKRSGTNRQYALPFLRHPSHAVFLYA